MQANGAAARGLIANWARHAVALLAVVVLLGGAACSSEAFQGTKGTPTVRAQPTRVSTSVSTPVATPPTTPTARATPTVTPSARPTSTVTPTATAPPSPVAATRVVALGQPVTLRPTIEVEVGGTSTTLIFEGVDHDSRCPTDVTCVQAGSVTALFDVWDGRAAHRGAVTLPSVGPATVTLGPLEVTLLAVEPAPNSKKPTQAFDYRAVVSISRPVARAVSGIDGLVTLGPLCPVARVDQPCPDKPYEAVLVVLTAAGQAVTTVKSDAAGRFTLQLEPGRYVIEPQLSSTSRLPFAAPVDVTVPSSGRAAVTIAYDTGIR